MQLHNPAVDTSCVPPLPPSSAWVCTFMGQLYSGTPGMPKVAVTAPTETIRMSAGQEGGGSTVGG